MEELLRQLIEGNSEANRAKWALEYKQQGKKVIGVVSSYVPEEIIEAAGMLPWRLTGTWRGNLVSARAYRSVSGCNYCTHVLESLLNGEYDFLDGLVFTDIDQDVLRLWDVAKYLQVKPFCHAMHVPLVGSEINFRFLRDEYEKMRTSLEEFAGVEITKEALVSSIITHNRTRELLARVYELRKREIPAITGAEALGLVTAAQVMPKAEFNRQLEELMPYLETRRAPYKATHPRILITSDSLDNPAYIELIEGGCAVVMDDMDTGSRYFALNVDTTLDDPCYALAKRYLSRPGAPSMANWEEQLENLLQSIKEYDVDGVLDLPLAWCYPQKFRGAFFKEKLDEKDIPYMSFDREYHIANAGQLKVRTDAFLEMLGDSRPVGR